MVALQAVNASNALLKTALPSGIVAVFVGATSGIGKSTLIKFAQHVNEPRIYFVGRSQQAADEILHQLQHDINPGGSYTFIKADVSLLAVVDDVCEQIRAKEGRINVLCQSQGTLDMSAGKTNYACGNKGRRG
jgi:NAD(P)-dependent dehydrogenase (short-subunit alcohol dehydrogenase family)